MKSRASLKKQKIWEFNEFTEDELRNAKSFTFETPVIIEKEDGVLYKLYNDDGQLAIVMFHSWDKFKEIK
jgi:ssDNA-binding replication factor A large subunit